MAGERGDIRRQALIDGFVAGSRVAQQIAKYGLIEVLGTNFPKVTEAMSEHPNIAACGRVVGEIVHVPETLLGVGVSARNILVKK